MTRPEAAWLRARACASPAAWSAAGDGRLALSAHGPVAFDVAYEARPHRDGSEVHASVSLRSAGGLFGRAAEHATAALLHAGALSVAIDRIAASAR
jgi:hypothetical protein